MGCDIHTYVEAKKGSRWVMIAPGLSGERVEDAYYEARGPFDGRNYGLFALLAGVRNYSGLPCLTGKPRGFPVDASDSVRWEYDYWGVDAHTASYMTLGELVTFDWNRNVEDRRVTKQIAPNVWDGGCTAKPGGGKITTFRSVAGPRFFEHLRELEDYMLAHNEHHKPKLGYDDIRVVFWFDN